MQLEKGAIRPTSGPTRRLSHLVGGEDQRDEAQPEEQHEDEDRRVVAESRRGELLGRDLALCGQAHYFHMGRSLFRIGALA